MNSTDCTIYLGPPGTGKTTALLNTILHKYHDISLMDIAFISFTKKAVSEARERIKSRQDKENIKLPFFRTIHSLCYLLTGVQKSQMMTPKRYEEFTDIYGCDPLKSKVDKLYSHDNDFETESLFFADNINRVTSSKLDTYQEDFSKAYKIFKESRGLLDFTDIIERAKQNSCLLKGFELLVIDEAQDLSPLQWDIVDILISKSKKVIVAGDDDQAIYTWAGADTTRFINFVNNAKKHGADVKILDVSHRVPKNILSYAKGMLRKIEDYDTRLEKVFRSSEYIKTPGNINGVFSLDEIDFSDAGPDNDYLILVRSNYQLEKVEQQLLDMGIAFDTPYLNQSKTKDFKLLHWLEKNAKSNTEEIPDDILKIILRKFKNDKNNIDFKKLINSFRGYINIPEAMYTYYENVLDKGYIIQDNYNVKISTIHSVKGGEASNVIIYKDIPKSISQSEDNKKIADEIRLWYVAFTRAKKSITTIEPKAIWNLNDIIFD